MSLEMVPITSTLTSLKTIITSTDIGDQARNRNGSSQQQTSASSAVDLESNNQLQKQKSTAKITYVTEGSNTERMTTTMATTITKIRTIRRRPKIKELNDMISCYLCHGYLINATTIDYCVHSFCRSCIVKYLETDKRCPICRSGGKQINLSNLRSDERLKSLIYKIVPGLFQNEHQRQIQFYADYNSNKDEELEDTNQCESEDDYFSPAEPISLSLEYHPLALKGCDKQQIPPIRYLQCPAAVTVHHLKDLFIQNLISILIIKELMLISYTKKKFYQRILV